MAGFLEWYERNKNNIKYKKLYNDYVILTQNVIEYDEDILDFDEWIETHYEIMIEEKS